ncbi:MAG: hypothetical protein LBM93_03795 [Oscillospiraceae bacterium]|jgi:hypothetical protein|nr:hypothetical protein [Oscillospiraceae bacterium]
MKIKGGTFAIYKGLEFWIKKIREDDLNVELSTINSSALKLGFYIHSVQKNGLLYKKKVPKSEISECYKIYVYAIYKGFNCFILGGIDQHHRDIDMINSIEPMSREMEIEKAKELGFYQWDRNAYMKENVPIEELELYEIREEYKI